MRLQTVFGKIAILAPFMGLSLVAMALTGQAAWAVPVLQLDIAGGTYDHSSDTIVTGAEDFQVDAVLTPGGNWDCGDLSDKTLRWFLDQTFYLSIALEPKAPLSAGGDLGSFTVNGVTIDVTTDMVYGNPPIENASLFQPRDSGDLPRHDIFPTYFTEIPFKFDPSLTTAIYNTADDPGGLTPGGTGGYYIPFQIGSSTIDGFYDLHFDLYNEVVRNAKCSTDTDVGIFAPFSHDAETKKVPEPGVLPLLVMGLAGLTLFSRRRFD